MVKRLSFYDVAAKKSFMSSKYTLTKRGVKGKTKRFAVAKSPLSGNMAWRIVAKDFKK